LEPSEEGGYVVYIPALPGCATQGETVEEALTMAKDAIEGYVAVMKEIAGVVPQEPQGAIIAKIPIAA
ncbi:MAG: type II toxin-antitoxin system HicB family antitoxin, partial [Candidatus Jacksonbacteria bacterium]|nr:type II toxin-antitoxin system HicB family antitoxin [Candidatus Jacksonbacteria bacterium]